MSLEKSDGYRIPLTHGRFAIVSLEDYPKVAGHKWRAKKDCNNWYAVTSIESNGIVKEISMHRMLMNAQRGQIVDHIDGDGLNNQRENLRFVTNTQNLQNSRKRKNNKSGFKGVHKARSRWRAMIQYNGKKFHIGYFIYPLIAKGVYDVVSQELFGKYARPNDPNAGQDRQVFEPFIKLVLSKIREGGPQLGLDS